MEVLIPFLNLLQENAQLWSSIVNKQGTSTKTSSIKADTVAPVIPQRDGIQDDYNDVLFKTCWSSCIFVFITLTMMFLFSSNFSSQESQLKIIIPLENLVNLSWNSVEFDVDLILVTLIVLLILFMF